MRIVTAALGVVLLGPVLAGARVAGGALEVETELGVPTLVFGQGTRVQILFTSTLAFDLTGLSVTQALPAQLLISTEAVPQNDCGGTFVATPGNSSFTLSGGTLAAGTLCAISVGVVGAEVGSSAVETLPSAIGNAQNVHPSASSSAPITVEPVDATLQLDRQDPDPSVPGETVTFDVSIMLPADGVPPASGEITVGEGANTCTIELPAAGCKLVFTSVGAHPISIAYSGDENYLPATINDSHDVSAEADLAIAIENPPPLWVPGEIGGFDLVVSNLGPSDANGATFFSHVPLLESATWSCTSGCGASGSGDVSASVPIAAGASATIHVEGTMIDTGGDYITLTASVTEDDSVIDLDQGNNSASWSVALALFTNGFD